MEAEKNPRREEEHRQRPKDGRKFGDWKLVQCSWSIKDKGGSIRR